MLPYLIMVWPYKVCWALAFRPHKEKLEYCEQEQWLPSDE